jgi:hypothetical protein
LRDNTSFNIVPESAKTLARVGVRCGVMRRSW